MKHLKYFLILAVGLSACTSNPAKQNENEVKKELEGKATGELVKIDPKEMPGNPVKMIGDEWMLITAGNSQSYNTMTAAWGALGVLWSKPIATCYVNPTRYTHEFMEKNDYFTLCFFDDTHKGALVYCGTNSGRDHTEKNKAEMAGLNPLYTENGSVYFKEAYLVLECRKLYADNFKPGNFTANVTMKNDAGEESLYNESQEIHTVYTGEIVNCWMRK